MDELNIKKIALLVGGLLGILALVFIGRNMFETNNAGFYQIKQAAVSGDLSVKDTPGTYMQNFGTITTYDYACTLDFTGGKQGQGDAAGSEGGQADKDLGGTAYVDTPFAVTFQGNSTADVSGIIKVKMPIDETNRLALHKLYRNQASVVDTLIRQSVGEAVKLAGPMFTAEEARTTKREEYTTLVASMLENGIYETYSTIETVKDEDGNVHNNAVTKLKLDDHGKPIVVKASPLKQYGLSIVQFSIRGLDFDKVTQDLMMAKKQAEQEKIVARAKAETAKQNAITAQQEGLAKVAETTAEENVKKTRLVVKAQADAESAGWALKQAQAEAAAKIAQGKAEAEVSKLKVAAGLSPLEKATIAKDTAIGVAHELAGVNLPASMVIVGGGGKDGGAVNPFSAVGLESLYNLSGKMAAQHPQTPRKASAPAAKGGAAAKADDAGDDDK